MHLPQLTRSLLFTLFVWSTSSFCYSQIETVFETNGYFTDQLVQKDTGRLRFTARQGGQTSIFNFNLTTGAIDSTLVNSSPLRQVRTTDERMFYITFDYINGYDGMHSLNVLDTAGNLMPPVEINEYMYTNTSKYSPKFGTICNERYYVNGFINGHHSIWESDGTSAGTTVIHQSTDKIISITTLNDTLFFATDNGSSYEFHYYTLNQTAQLYASVPKTNATFFLSGIVGTSDQHFYFNGKDSADTRTIYRCNFSGPPEVFLPGQANHISFFADSFLLRTVLTGPSSWELYKGSIVSPSSATHISFESAIQSQSMKLDMHYGGPYYRSRSIENGIELVKMNDQDSLELIQTTALGPKSGIIIREEGYVMDQYRLEPKFHIDSNQVSYGIFTNGLDSNYYMYRFDNNGEQSLFQVDDPDEIESVFTSGNYVYWFTEINGKLSLKRRSLLLPFENQTALPNDPETWFRQFAVSYKSDVVYSNDLRPNIKGIQFDDANNTYLEFVLNDYATAVDFISSDATEVVQKWGSNVFVKYDSEGNFQWANGIGGALGLWFNEGEFTVRPNGNIVALGHYFQKAYFDDDSLTTPRAGFFLAELDANNGHVLWKKTFAEKFYGNDILLDKIEIDEDGNIYVAFMYKEYYTNIDGIGLNSIKSPVNALAKFDPSGQIVWAKNIETPWLDYYGRTRSMDYNEEFQTLTTVQSIGYYNVSSSCEYHEFDYYIQEFDKDGNALIKHELTGSDLGSITVGTRTSDNRFFGHGYFRGTINLDHFVSTTDPLNSCHRTEGFGFVYDGQINEIIKASTTDNAVFLPLDISKTEENIYVYGTDEENELTLLKFSNEGQLLAYKKLNQYADPFQWLGNRNYFDITNSHIVLVGSDFRRDPNFDVIPLVNTMPSISVLKIDNDGWTPAGDWMNNISIDLANDSEFIIYPNPFTDYVEILFADSEFSYTRFQIVDAMGRIIESGKLSDLQHQTIELNDLRSGLYIITLSNDSDRSSQQIIKL